MKKSEVIEILKSFCTYDKAGNLYGFNLDSAADVLVETEEEDEFGPVDLTNVEPDKIPKSDAQERYDWDMIHESIMETVRERTKLVDGKREILNANFLKLVGELLNIFKIASGLKQ